MSKNKSKANKNSNKKTFIVSLTIIIPLILIVLLPISYFYIYQNRIYPNVYIENINVGGLSKAEATQKIQSQIYTPEKIVLTHQDQAFDLDLQELSFSYNVDKTINESFEVYRKETFPYFIFPRLKAPFTNQTINYSFSLNEQLLQEHLSVIAGGITIDAINPRATIENNAVIIIQGSVGIDVDVNKLKGVVMKNFETLDNTSITIPNAINDTRLSGSEYDELTQRATKLKNSNLEILHDKNILEINGNSLLALLDAQAGYNLYEIDKIISNISQEIDREPKNPIFVYENNIVKEFSPSIDGIVIQKEKLGELIVLSLEDLEKSNETKAQVTIPTVNTKSAIKTEEVNDLGIKEIIGEGHSLFKGSIASRVHNIGLGASKFNGVLIEPGETLSFNEIIGDISQLTGYKQSYIISNGKTILGDGGGVCQVSTTLFRAALNAGLPIEERRAHSYRVTYYEQGSEPGLDATIYSPTTDLKIINDTENYILIQTLFDSKTATLDFEIYGTSDGRIASISKPIITGNSPPPEDQYKDDPSLPEGQIEQVDWKAWGAKVQFDYTVERDGEILHEEKFYSNYRPWSAKFLRGTGPVI